MAHTEYVVKIVNVVFGGLDNFEAKWRLILFKVIWRMIHPIYIHLFKISGISPELVVLATILVNREKWTYVQVGSFNGKR